LRREQIERRSPASRPEAAALTDDSINNLSIAPLPASPQFAGVGNQCGTKMVRRKFAPISNRSSSDSQLLGRRARRRRRTAFFPRFAASGAASPRARRALLASPAVHHSLRVTPPLSRRTKQFARVKRRLRQPPLPQPEISFAGEQALAKDVPVRSQHPAFRIQARISDQNFFESSRDD